MYRIYYLKEYLNNNTISLIKHYYTNKRDCKRYFRPTDFDGLIVFSTNLEDAASLKTKEYAEKLVKKLNKFTTIDCMCSFEETDRKIKNSNEKIGILQLKNNHRGIVTTHRLKRTYYMENVLV